MEYIPCIGNSFYSFWRILLKLYSCFQDGLKICILFFRILKLFFLHFNLDIFSSLYAVNVWKKKAKAAFLWFHMRNLSLAGYNCSGGASCMACSFIFHLVKWKIFTYLIHSFASNSLMNIEFFHFQLMKQFEYPLYILHVHSLFITLSPNFGI